MTGRHATPEDALQIATATYCRLALHPSVIAIHIPNEGIRSPSQGAKAKAKGLLPGAPDWLIIWPNHNPSADQELDGLWPHVGTIELKAGKNGLSTTQGAFRDRAVKIGCNWAVCWSLDGFIAILEAWGVPTKSPSAGGRGAPSERLRPR